MNHNRFLPPVSQLRPISSELPATGNGITRRSFIKRTGGATVATMVTWSLVSQTARASGNEGSKVKIGAHYEGEGPIVVDVLKTDWNSDAGGTVIWVKKHLRDILTHKNDFFEDGSPEDFEEHFCTTITVSGGVDINENYSSTLVRITFNGSITMDTRELLKKGEGCPNDFPGDF
jgi:hypothetical protein